MVDLTKKPFYLKKQQIQWVEDTISGMTLEEKLGQLMIVLKAKPGVNEEEIKESLQLSHQGGLRWQGGGGKDEIYHQNITFQRQSKIPLLIAANCDDGGSGVLPEGTFVATAAQAAAGESIDTAYHMGLVAGREATSIGCNWMFNPVADIYMNWRNTIVNTRCFGDNADSVIKHARGYIKGIKDANPNMACCAKHFPGDGVEELDQHLVMGINDLSVEDWQKSFGKVYSTLIEDGIESVMIGHIAFPAMSKALVPGIKYEELMPATFAPELIEGLLRKEMGFNGLVLTDATHMIGFSAVIKRSEALPKTIASGCDMILFANDIVEDLGYLKEGYDNGIITEERLHDALLRIIGLKAKLNLEDEAVRIPDVSLKDKWVGCKEHEVYRIQAAKTCITLVKDTKKYLPVNPEVTKNILLIYQTSTPNSRAYNGDPVKNIVIEEFERAGFNVTVAPNFYDLELENGPSFMNSIKMMDKGARETFVSKYDMVFLVMNFKGYAQSNNVRLNWSCHHSSEMPWYIPEVPTVGISLNLTNHLIDVPQLKTYINAYASSRDHIRETIEKICGKSEFSGTASDTVFCNRWEARL